MEDASAMPYTETDKFLPPPVVMDRTSLSRTTLWRMVRAGTFPRPIPLSPGRVAWSEAEVSQWMAERSGCRQLEAA